MIVNSKGITYVARLAAAREALGCANQQRLLWAWTPLPGGVPDADDTPGALLALASWYESANCSHADRASISEAAASAIDWLLAIQNSDR